MEDDVPYEKRVGNADARPLACSLILSDAAVKADVVRDRMREDGR